METNCPSRWQVSRGLLSALRYREHGHANGRRPAATVDMRFRFERDWNDHEPTVANAALGDDVLGEMADLSGSAAQHGDFDAGMMIEMHVKRRDR